MTWPSGKFYDGMWAKNLKEGTGIFRGSETLPTEAPPVQKMGKWKDDNLVTSIDKTSSKFVIQ